MTKLTLGTHPYLLGFEQLERLVERTAKTGNDGSKVDAINATGSGTYYYQVCERLAVKCSAKVKVVF